MCPSNEEIVAKYNIISDVIELNKEVSGGDTAGHIHNKVNSDNMENSDWVNCLETTECILNESSGSDNDSLVMSFKFMGLATNLAHSGNYSGMNILLDTGSTMSVFKEKCY